MEGKNRRNFRAIRSTPRLIVAPRPRPASGGVSVRIRGGAENDPGRKTMGVARRPAGLLDPRKGKVRAAVAGPLLNLRVPWQREVATREIDSSPQSVGFLESRTLLTLLLELFLRTLRDGRGVGPGRAQAPGTRSGPVGARTATREAQTNQGAQGEATTRCRHGSDTCKISERDPSGPGMHRHVTRPPWVARCHDRGLRPSKTGLGTTCLELSGEVVRQIHPRAAPSKIKHPHSYCWLAQLLICIGRKCCVSCLFRDHSPNGDFLNAEPVQTPEHIDY